MKTVAKIVVFTILVVVFSNASAKEKVVGMSKRVYDAINKVQLLIDEESWTEVIAELDELRERKLTSYESAHVLNMTGYAYYQMEKMDLSMAAYLEAIAQPDLPDSQLRALLTTVSQLYLLEEDYPNAQKFAQQLLQIESKVPHSAVSYAILARAYIGQELFQEAVDPLRTAIQKQRDTGIRPAENWLAMLASVYFSLEDFPAMRDTLYELIPLYPKEQYLMNLAALHGQLGESEKQLALVESLMDDRRLSRGHHLLSLANLLLANNLPHKAAKLLEQETASGRIEANERNLQLQSQAWYMAGEEQKAIPPLEKAAALAEDGELYLRVARLYMDIYAWEGAEVAANDAVKKGGLSDPGNAYLLQGMALARMNEFSRAKKAFRRAVEYENHEKWARQWLRFIDVEMQRISSLQM